jgi:hypothetical protein
MDDIFDEYIKGTTKRLAGLDNLIYKILLDYFVDNLDIKGNKIKYTASNIDAVNKIESTTSMFGSALTKIGEYIVKGIKEILGLTVSDFAKFDTGSIKKSSDVLETLEKHAATSINQNLNLQIIFADVKKDALALMSKPDGISLSELREQLYDKVVNKGMAQKYYSRWTHDIYSQYQRVGANQVRKKLGLKYAIYQGGLIESSRPFCEQRNGKVFSEEEIEKWINLNFEGKPDVGYNPIADLGGYNCRHRLDWISEELAKKKRPDLF